jgi:GH25 family lysozyme M1 (1,4-beta-N-acetylmuramidase)
MKRAGASFVFIKASDGLSSEDSLARPLALADSTAAKSAGLYVGYYHRARLPVTNDQETLRADAISQARLVHSRLTELGGYRGGQVLPYVLDIEGVDAQINSESVTLWTATWVDEVVRQTKRRPIIYSYRSFLASRYTTDAATTTLLRNSHLWLAHPGNPADPQVVPGHFNSGAGCYQTAWTKKDCSAVWTFWQYTASGDRDVFGIPWSPKSGNCPAGANYCFAGTGTGNKHLDLNVFSGTAADMAALANGTWKRTAFDY